MQCRFNNLRLLSSQEDIGLQWKLRPSPLLNRCQISPLRFVKHDFVYSPLPRVPGVLTYSHSRGQLCDVISISRAICRLLARLDAKKSTNKLAYESFCVACLLLKCSYRTFKAFYPIKVVLHTFRKVSWNSVSGYRCDLVDIQPFPYRRGYLRICC